MPVSKDEAAGRMGFMVRDGAEFIIGPRFARTRWRLLTMRAESLEHDRKTYCAAVAPPVAGWASAVLVALVTPGEAGSAVSLLKRS